MNVLILASGPDTGGQGIRLVEAFAKEQGWTVRSMARSASYMAYDTDLPYRRVTLEQLYQEADVVHVRNDFTLYDPMADKYGPKPVVIHYHGSKFRANPNHWIREQKRRHAIGLVSTLDLWLLAPDDLMWLPAPYSIEWLETR